MLAHKDKLSEELEAQGWKIQQFKKLGMSIYDAVDAVDQGIDYHDVELFLKEHPNCSPQMAAKIV